MAQLNFNGGEKIGFVYLRPFSIVMLPSVIRKMETQQRRKYCRYNFSTTTISCAEGFHQLAAAFSRTNTNN